MPCFANNLPQWSRDPSSVSCITMAFHESKASLSSGRISDRQYLLPISVTFNFVSFGTIVPTRGALSWIPLESSPSSWPRGGSVALRCLFYCLLPSAVGRANPIRFRFGGFEGKSENSPIFALVG